MFLNFHDFLNVPALNVFLIVIAEHFYGCNFWISTVLVQYWRIGHFCVNISTVLNCVELL